MLPDDVVQHGQHVLTVCNACRYCERSCPVFPALEKRRTFGAADLTYLANLCHNCGECLYACQFAPPHEFGINVPSLFAEVRTRSYEAHAWPPTLGHAFRRNGFRTGLAALALVFSALLLATIANGQAVVSSDGSADFYGVIPHGVMVTTFGGVSVFVLIALAISGVRFWRDADAGTPGPGTGIGPAVRDALTLRHLHGSGSDCTSNLEVRCRGGGGFITARSTASCCVSRPRRSLRSITACLAGMRRTLTRAFRCCSVRRVDSGCSIGPLGLAALRQTRDPALGEEEHARPRQPVPRAALPH